MGLFTKNTLTAEETIEVVSYVAIMTVGLFLRKGEMLDGISRSKITEQRITMLGKKASTWHKSKIAIAGDDLGRMVIANSNLLECYRDAYEKGSPDQKDEVNSYISELAQALVIQKGLV